ncbi:MAG: hypothetical protein EZS28_009455 [Streblomastix strix]|uniref:Uncharacterized protein n=1 Tax=Streblomastix strix TaxID=222440 RepID=A0A5J4WKF9_9EUKA|nr:MAG: hypothetical protein EZS28_009455 [Streblomastix strix]
MVYANNRIAMTLERAKLLFDVEIQVMSAESLFTTSTFSTHDEDYEAKMKYLCRRILDNDMKAARREDPENLFIKKEKRSRNMEDIKPIQAQKSARGEDGEHTQKMVIDLEQGDGNKVQRREGLIIVNEGGGHIIEASVFGKADGGDSEQENGGASIYIQAAGLFGQIIYIQRPGQFQICRIGLESSNAKELNKAGTRRLIRICDDWADTCIISLASCNGEWIRRQQQH